MNKYIPKMAMPVSDEGRKDVRLYFHKGQQVIADCETNDCHFTGEVKDISSSGIFINTDTPLGIGREVALTFKFPESGNKVMATGKVVRTTPSGIGVEIMIIFKEEI